VDANATDYLKYAESSKKNMDWDGSHSRPPDHGWEPEDLTSVAQIIHILIQCLSSLWRHIGGATCLKTFEGGSLDLFLCFRHVRKILLICGKERNNIHSFYTPKFLLFIGSF
jgi:hypothetical protein